MKHCWRQNTYLAIVFFARILLGNGKKGHFFINSINLVLDRLTDVLAQPG